MKKRGLSGVVITILIILISLVAIAIIWIAVRPLFDIQDRTNIGDFTTDFKIVQAFDDRTNSIVYLSVRRNAGDAEVIGFNVILKDADGNAGVFRNNTLIQELETRAFTVHYANSNLAELKEVAIAPIFLINGKERIGSVADTYLFLESQFLQVSECNNGMDDDSDTWFDMDDPGCQSLGVEEDGYDPNFACHDGGDNDGDFLADGRDSGCSSPTDNDEADPTNNCGDGNFEPPLEECDDGNIDSDDTYLDNIIGDDDGSCVVDIERLSSSCKTNTCGDGYRNAISEQCDDDNTQNGDGCSSTCQIETSCDLTSASWSTSQATEGDLVTLTVQGTNCDGEIVNIELWENDFFDDDLVKNLTDILIIGPQGSLQWIVEYHRGDDITPEIGYYFRAILESNPVEVEDSGIMDVEEAELCPFGNNLYSDFSQFATCDIRLTHQNRYTTLNLVPFNVSNDAWTISGGFYNGGIDNNIYDFLSWDYNTQRNRLDTYLNNNPELDRNTDGLIIIDIESEAHPGDWGFWAEQNGTAFQRQIFDAYMMRVDVTRELLPNAKIGIYGVVVGTQNGRVNPAHQRRMDGYRNASEYGVYDNVDYLVPILYTWFNSSHPSSPTNLNFTILTLNETRSLKKSDGSDNGIVALVGFVERIGDTPLDYPKAIETLQYVQELYKDDVDIITYWLGSENSNGVNITAFYENVKPVPAICFCN